MEEQRRTHPRTAANANPPVAATLALTCGPMFAGKTTWLLQSIRRQIRAGKFVFVAKPSIDSRFDRDGIPALHSHPGDAFPAVRLPTRGALLSGLSQRELANFHAADFVALDEAHMFQTEPLLDFVRSTLLHHGKCVALAGLDADL